MPPEFNVQGEGYVWAHQRYEAFADRAAGEIKAKLGKPDMSREEMLNASSPNGNFEEWKQQCIEWENTGRIPPYMPPADKRLA